MGRILLAASPALFALFVPFVGGLQAAEPDMTQKQIAGVVRVESLTIPVPGELFAAIGKLGRPDWTSLVRVGTPAVTANRAQIALVLGTLVADACVAIEAQDSQGVKNIGKEIINLAEKLNASKGVLGRGNSLNDFAEHNDWDALREELEATQNEVKLDMKAQKDAGLITLVTLGAWLRSVQIVSGLVEAAYTPESARLLHQSGIITYLHGQLTALPSVRTHEGQNSLVEDVHAALEKSLPFALPATPSEQDVRDLHQIMNTIVARITKGAVKP